MIAEGRACGRNVRLQQSAAMIHGENRYIFEN